MHVDAVIERMVLPAHAGMILPYEARKEYINSAPRACGDDPS